MPKYRVNRSAGYPVIEGVDANVAVEKGEVKFYQFGAEFESDDPQDAAAVEQSYLTVAQEQSIMAAAIEAHDDSDVAYEPFTKEEKSKK